MAEEIKKVIEIDTSKSTKSIKQLRQEVAALTDEIENLEIGSSEYTDKVENLVKVQGDLNVATESMQGTTVNSIKVFDSLNQIAGGLAGGISAVSATFTLFGKDNENLQKTMVKLQAAIAIVQGISGLKGLGEGVLKAITSFKALTVSMNASAAGTKGLTLAMKGLKAALVSTGIGALIVGIGMLIEYLMSATEEAENLNDALSKIGQISIDTQNAFGSWDSIIESKLAALEEQERRRLITKEERLKKEKELYESAQKTALAFYGQLEQDYSEPLRSIIEERSGLFNLEDWWNFTEILGYSDYVWNAEDYEEKIANLSTSLYEKYKEGNMALLNMLSEDEKNILSKLENEEKVRAERANYYGKKAQETQREITNLQIDEENARIDKANAAAQERLAQQRAEAEAEKKQTEEHNKALLRTIEDFYKENKRIVMSEEDRAIDELKEKYQNQLDALIEAKEAQLITEEEYKERIESVYNAYDDEYLEILNNNYQEEIEARLAAVQEMIDRESQLWANKEAALQASRKTYTTNVYDVGLFAKEGESYQSKQNIEDEYAATIAYNEQLFNLTKDRIERENELLFDQQDILKEMLNNSLITQEEYFNQVQGLQLQQEANDIALSNARNQREEADLRAFKERQDKKQQAVEATFQVASSLAGAAANIAKAEANNDKKTEKERAKAFKVYKALATTQAIIDTVSSAQSAYKSMVGIPYVGPFLAPIAAAAAVALGIANIRSIQQETMPTAAGGSESVTAPSALNTPPIEYTRNLLGDKETESLNQPVKCYVLESDITDTQNKVAVTESNASF